MSRQNVIPIKEHEPNRLIVMHSICGKMLIVFNIHLINFSTDYRIRPVNITGWYHHQSDIISFKLKCQSKMAINLQC